MSDQYNYGPPTTQAPQGAPATITGAEVEPGTSSTPHTPPAGTGTSSGTSGSASEESGQNPDFQSTVTGTAPTTSAGATPTVVSVNGTKFTNKSGIVLNGVLIPTTYVSSTQIRGTFTGTAGAKTVKVQTGTYLSATSATYTFT